MYKSTALFLFLLLFTSAFAQNPVPSTTSASARLKGFETRKALQEQSPIKNIAFESIGPSVFGGRVVDVAVNPADPTEFYVAYASGGLWYTNNNGTTLTPVFDQQAVMTIGDVAVDWKKNVIWVGTGENNSSRSSYAGLGMYRSDDGGKTWNHRGLPESHHIGRIVLHPDDPNTLWVAVLGNLYSPSKDRGVYKTTNGGKSWEKTLFANENAGAIELLIDPENPQILYAATWERTRRAWNFTESGPGSGIHKSTDGGKSWKIITTAKSGFPTGQGVGRIGMDIYKKDGKTVLYAVLDNYFRRPAEDTMAEEKGLTKDMLRNMPAEEFLKLEEQKIEKYLRGNGFPEQYSSAQVMTLVKNKKILPSALVEYLEDSNSLLFDTPVKGAEIYRSDDEGATWTKTHDDYIDNVYFSYGYYFGQIRVSPHDPDKIYFVGVPVLRSEDGGKTFENINGSNVHVDHHALWLNPKRDKHLLLGNDGGLVISYDDGENWVRVSTPAVGQFYSVVLDNAKPYRVYGGLQDNGVWMGPSNYQASPRWQQTGQYPYKSIMGGDGMQVAVDHRENDVVYTGFQFGNYFRLHRGENKRDYITPKHDLGDRPYRWNWQTPIHLSTHNQDILYMGANKLLRSMNQGNDFSEISADLTKGGRKGDVSYGTLTSIHESPLKFGLLYVGTDDGYIHLTKDGGNTWKRISDRLPQDLWVSRVWASKHEEGRVYAALNGYRWDDFNSYIYASDDYGTNWRKIGKDLPAEPVNVIKDDPENPDILYVGTDHGLYISMDRGQNFTAASGGLPAVAIHDLAVHPREKEIVLGTHGRSFWKGSVKELQQLDASVIGKQIYAFQPEQVRYSSRWGAKGSIFSPTREATIELPFYAVKGGNTTVAIKTEKGDILRQMTLNADAGLNYAMFDGSIDAGSSKSYESYLNENSKKEEQIELEAADNGKYYLRPGKYTVDFSKEGTTVSSTLVIFSR